MTYYTVSNIAGGDSRRFRSGEDGRPSDASIRHARRQGPMGYACSDPEMADAIQGCLDDQARTARKGE